MVKVTVKLYGIRHPSGIPKEYEIEIVPGSKIRDIISRLETLTDGLQAIEDLVMKQRAIVMINGLNINYQKGLDTVLNGKETISILPTVTGGGRLLTRAHVKPKLTKKALAP